MGWRLDLNQYYVSLKISWFGTLYATRAGARNITVKTPVHQKYQTERYFNVNLFGIETASTYISRKIFHFYYIFFLTHNYQPVTMKTG